MAPRSIKTPPSLAPVDPVDEPNDQNGSQKWVKLHRPNSRRELSWIIFYPCRVFKKTSPNSMLTLYLPTRDLVTCNGKVDTLRGVLHVDKDFAKGQRIFGQLTLTFRWVAPIEICSSCSSSGTIYISNIERRRRGIGGKLPLMALSDNSRLIYWQILHLLPLFVTCTCSVLSVR